MSSPHPPSVQCSARSSRSGERCKCFAIVGGNVCSAHGGTAKQVRAKAEQRVAQWKAQRAIHRISRATYGDAVDVDPQAALLEELHRTAGHVAWLGDLVGTLEESQLVQDTKLSVLQASARVELYQRERAHLVKVSTEAIKAGISEHHVRIAEEQAATFIAMARTSSPTRSPG